MKLAGILLAAVLVSVAHNGSSDEFKQQMYPNKTEASIKGNIEYSNMYDELKKYSNDCKKRSQDILEKIQ